ncbi:hypothetical protein HNP40_001016 [Mycobacteroides chelonae]|nr:hypothetical protein [Mycobacteroides chelonae]
MDFSDAAMSGRLSLVWRADNAAVVAFAAHVRELCRDANLVS